MAKAVQQKLKVGDSVTWQSAKRSPKPFVATGKVFHIVLDAPLPYVIVDAPKTGTFYRRTGRTRCTVLLKSLTKI